MPKIAPIETLFESTRGPLLPLPPGLARLYGTLRMPAPRSHPYVFSNFVSTLDGVVSLQSKGHSGGGDISGFNAQDPDGHGAAARRGRRRDRRIRDS